MHCSRKICSQKRNFHDYECRNNFLYKEKIEWMKYIFLLIECALQWKEENFFFFLPFFSTVSGLRCCYMSIESAMTFFGIRMPVCFFFSLSHVLKFLSLVSLHYTIWIMLHRGIYVFIHRHYKKCSFLFLRPEWLFPLIRNRHTLLWINPLRFDSCRFRLVID